ncbi:MAG: alpha/beta fold hydrolase [Saprospiraceae bacterium]
MNISVLRMLRRKRFYLLLALVGFLFYAYHFLSMRLSDQSLRAALSENAFHFKPEINYHYTKERRVRYVEMGQDSLPLIVFVHGAPSSSRFWEQMLTDSLLLSNAKMLAVDRPGYGYSGYGKPEISVQKQAAIIANIIREERPHHSKIILHGSSYGGTVAARIAMDYPDLIDGLLLQSASVAPGEEKTYDISYYTTHWATEWFVPGALKVANHEKLSHKTQLEQMRPFWRRIKAPTIILHGAMDKLIYPINAEYARQMLTQARSVDLIMVKQSAHDLLWTRRDLLIASLLKLLSKQHVDLYTLN